MRICRFIEAALYSLVFALESTPLKAVATLDVLTKAEREQVLYGWNDTAVEYPREKCVHELFEEQAEKQPDAVAVVYGEESLSYGELNRRANRLAGYLRSLGVREETRVGICMERGLAMIESLLAVLKAGAGYVPLDPGYPQERLRYMLEDSGAEVLLTADNLREQFSGICAGIRVVDVKEEAEQWKSVVAGNLDKKSAGPMSRHLAYVIYTSGSTGQPKGVTVEHGGVTNRLLWMQDTYQLENKDAVLQKTPIGFDVSVWEFFWPLLAGARLVMARPEGHKDPGYLAEVIREKEITTIHFVPSMLEAFLGDEGVAWCQSLARIVCSGEAISTMLVHRCQEQLPQATLHNLYGPTEATVDVTAWSSGEKEIPETTIPIGMPIGNTQVYILDGRGEPAPIGVAGEIYIGGAGVARGYQNRPDLTAERFVPNPFGSGAGERMYRTGDLGRWQRDGNIEFLGRNDDQVKVRGFRIELGEIEARLREHEAIREAVVAVREDEGGEKRLVAYYTSKQGEVTSAEQLREHLKKKVPEYMVPSAYVVLESLPLTANGKLDRKALPAPGVDAYDMMAYEEPQGKTEEELALIWQALLKVERVGRQDTFFALGGHSLLAVRMIMRVQQTLGVEVAIRDVFAHPVLCDFAGVLEKAVRVSLPSIGRVAKRVELPLSFAQQRLWFLAQMEGGSEAYHIALGLRLTGDLDAVALRRALDRIVGRHEALRTRFVMVEGEPKQQISTEEESCFELEEHDLVEQEEGEQAVRRISEEEGKKGFDLERGPLIRGRLIRVREQEHVLLLTMHHIVSDAWSLGILRRELSVLYGAYTSGGEDPLPELEIQYADYAVWQRKWIEGEVLREQGEYWKRSLRGAPGLLELPTDHGRPAQQDYAGTYERVVLEEGLTERLRALSRRAGTTLYMTVLAGWAALLGRLSGETEVVIGTPTANRGRAEIENLIGFFVNTLALRIEVGGRQTVWELLEEVKKQALEAQRHQDIPFEQVVELVQPERSLSRSPIFQVMFAWQNREEGKLEFPGVQLGSVSWSGHRVAKFDITMSLQETGEKVVGGLEYATSLFEKATIQKYLGYWLKLLEGMVANEQEEVAQLSMLTKAEREQVLYGWNDTAVEYPREKCVHELFEEQAEKQPDAVAVVYGEESLSYGELNRRANRLAGYLRSLGVREETRVGICMERGLAMIESLLAVLKAGAGYVPLDPGYPQERLRYMLEDSGAEVLLTADNLREQFSGICAGIRVVDVKEEAEQWKSVVAGNLDKKSAGPMSRHLAYVIYTSGSTGQPKGVTVEHGGVTNRLLWMQDTYQLENKDAVLQKTPIGFDVSVWEFFWPLLAGARLVMARPEGHKDPGYLAEVIREKEITTIHFVPSMLEAFLGDEGVAWCQSLARIVCSGEAISTMLVHRCQEQLPQATLHNLYGPTEATVDVTAWSSGEKEIPETTIPIGMPIGNTQVYILDGRGEPAPIGVAGEIYIGGAGVARGYQNRPDLTAERFVPNPFGSGAGERMYRTGDLGRWQRDGNIEFLGRNDDQVKVRGFRIELGEIEARLREHEAIREAVVAVREDEGGEKRLVAYYTSKQGEVTSAEQLREHLKKKVPEYMVPTIIMELEAMPLTANGKLDRKALPAPDLERMVEWRAPRTPEEEILCGLFAEVLGVERVGLDDNFFDLGGHSLMATRLVSRIRGALGAEIPIRRLFEWPTVGELGKVLREDEGERRPELRVGARPERLPLSYAQQRLWFIDRLEGGSAEYNMVQALRLKGELDEAALRRAIETIVERHESLRTRFEELDGERVQVIEDVWAIEMEVEDVQGWAEEEQQERVREVLRSEARTAFDLRSGPVLRVKLVRVAEQEHVLVRTMHHIVSDGWSEGIFNHELAVLYEAYRQGDENPLPELAVQYGDFAVWQRRWLEEGGELERGMRYWREQLSGIPERLELPTDRARGERQTFGAGACHAVLTREQVQGLKGVSQKHQATLYMTMLGVFGALLWRYSGQDDIVVGTPIANRQDGQLEQLIGFFVNTLVMRMRVRGEESFGELLGAVRRMALGAYQHQDVPFERLVEELSPERKLNATPVFQVVFDLQNAPTDERSMKGLEVKGIRKGELQVRYDLELHAREQDGQIGMYVLYNRDLFERWRVEQMLSHYVRMLDAVVADPVRAVGRLEILSAAEREQVLYEWNRTERELPERVCVHELFEEQAEKQPDAVAVVYGEESLSYGELNRRANRIARYLLQCGAGREMRIGVCLERSTEMIAVLLGILKSGGAYVPLDPEYPQERLEYMIEDAGLGLIVTEKQLRDALSVQGNWFVAVVSVDEDNDSIEQESEENLGLEIAGSQLAYVMYTSGSTGLPKGVGVEHRSIQRLVCNGGYVEWKNDDVMLQMAPVSFDASTFEIWGALLNGVRLVVAPAGRLLLEEIGVTLVQREVTVLWLTAALFHAMQEERKEELTGVRQLLVGGDVLSKRHVAEYLNRQNEGCLVNGYGPTEGTTFTCCYRMGRREKEEGEKERGVSVPIGMPIGNTQVYILDGRGEPAPIGVAGEIYIGGAGVARGYQNRPDLTAERFVPNPFGSGAGERMYRTGDLGRWQRDGNIEFLGRNDDQVKVRGFRIELGEIEARLREHEAIREAVVAVREDEGGEKRLVAYYTSKQGEVTSAEQLREHLKKKVPEYMVPTIIMELEAMPLTANGKIDRKAMPSPEHMVLDEQNYVMPRDSTEERLAKIWSEVLKAPHVGIRDNFFQLGGDSILILRIMGQAREQGLNFSLQDVFEHQTIEALSQVTTREEGEVYVNTAPFDLVGEDVRKLLPADVEDAYPLARLQLGMLFHSAYAPSSGVYHDVISYRLRVPYDADKLQATVDCLTRRHDVLRASINMTSFSQPLQLIHSKVHLKVVEQDWRLRSAVEKKAGLRNFIDTERKTVFDLKQPPLLRIFVHRLTNDDFQCSLSFHHAMLDGWSEASLITELLNGYNRLLANSTLEAQPLAVTYRDYIALEQQAMTSTDTRAFWKQLLEGHNTTPVPMRDWHKDQMVANLDVVQSHVIELNEPICAQIQSLAKELGVPLKTVLLAAHIKTLQLLSGDSDVTTGVVLNGRPEIGDAEQTLGLFLNTVPYRLRSDSNTWKRLIQETYEAEQKILPHRRYPMASLQEQMGRKALFETVFNYMHFHVYKQLGTEGSRVAAERGGYARTNFDFIVHFGVSVEAGKISGIVECDTGAMSAAALKHVAQYYGRILAGMTEHRIGDLRLEEEQAQIQQWNNTAVEYPREKCVHELFEEQAEKQPDAVAVVYGEESLSYGELNRRANRLGDYLRGLGVKEETRVAVCVERSLEMVVGILGVLKARGGYVPLDPGYPEERLRYMLEDSGAVVLLTQRGLREQLQGMASDRKIAVVEIGEEQREEEKLGEGEEEKLGERRGQRLAYVIYTSGSTGQPKGVMVEHHSIVRLVKGTEYVSFGKEERVLQMAPVSFDAATFEIWGALLNGGQLVVMEAGRKSLREIGQGLEEKEITVAWLTGPLYHLMVDTEMAGLRSVRQLVSGGDMLDPERVRKHRAELEDGQVVVNGYGPTEGTTFTCCYRMGRREKEEGEKERGVSVPIGMPIGNTQVYILDGRGEPAPIGVAGEIYIGGAGVARGYQNRPDLTAERFVPNPFGSGAGERMYRTGDLGRWQRDGNIEFLGRNDDQVKVRGFRIELGEIEARLREHEAIREAVVAVREDEGGEKRLVAYYTSKQGEVTSAEQLREHLKKKVPEYMVPTIIMELEVMPLTPNGKIDRKAMPSPEVRSMREYEEPAGETEMALALIWRELLKVQRVGRQDDFFALGGHSLLAVRMVTRVHQVLGVELQIGDVFTYPLLSPLAGLIIDAQLNQFNTIDLQNLMKTLESYEN